MAAAGWPVAALVLAGCVGLAVGLVVLQVGKAGSSDAWGELGAFILAMLVGVVATGVAYVVGIIVAARIALPAGQRAWPAVLALGVPATLMMFTAGVEAASPVDVWPPVYLLAGAAVLVSGPAAFAWGGTRAGRVRLAAAAAAAALAVGVGAAGSVAAAGADASRVASKLPLVLFDGRSTDAPFDGWRRDRFTVQRVSQGSGPFAGGQQTYLKYFTSQGVVFVTMHTTVGPCVDDGSYRCTVTGRQAQGELRRYERVREYGSYPLGARIDVLVYADGSAVSVQGPDTASGRIPLSDPSADELLATVLRVNQRSFEAAVDAPLRTR